MKLWFYDEIIERKQLQEHDEGIIINTDYADCGFN
jgi:hypothetical protein